MAVARSISLDRMVRAVEKVRERLLKVAAALDAASIPYAIVGGNAVAAWVSTVDEAAVRNTRDVDVLIRRENLDQVRTALEKAGFTYRQSGGVDLFLEDPNGSARDAAHVIFASELVREGEPMPNPGVEDSVRVTNFQVLSLAALVQIKLTAFRRKDQVHLQDMLEVGLIDQTWCNRLPPILAERLQTLIDDPNG